MFFSFSLSLRSSKQNMLGLFIRFEVVVKVVPLASRSILAYQVLVEGPIDADGVDRSVICPESTDTATLSWECKLAD